MKNKLFKRMSAAFVAICIAVSLIPAVFAEVEGTKTYEFYAGAVSGVSGFNAGDGVNEVTTFGSHGWYFKDIDDKAHHVGITGDVATWDNGAKTATNRRVMQLHTDDLKLYVKRKTATTGTKDDPYYELSKIQIAFVLKAPEKGFYRVEGKGMYKNQLYLDKYKVGKENVEDYVNDKAKFYSTTNFAGSSATDYSKTGKQVNGIVYSDGVSDLLLAIDTLDATSSYRTFRELSLVPINPTISLAVDNPVLKVGETAKAYVNATWTETTSTTQKMLNSFVDYELSADPSITIDELGNIKAIKAGPTTITVTYGEDTYEATVNVVKPTVLPEEETIETTTVTFKAGAYTGGSVSNDDVQNVEIGTDVTVTATPNTGYTFAYWKNAAGVVLSTKAEETFKVNTNMGVIAVFDKIPTDDAIPVYFYNGNGLPLGNASVAKNTTFGVAKTAANVPAKPTLTGFVFSHWSDKDAETPILDTDTITALTRAVAIYEDADTTYTVKNGDVTVASGKKYGEDVTVTSTADDFSYWKLGNKIMSYDKSFTFKVYGNITLTEVTGESVTAAPTLILDVVNGNYFLTYDEANYELIEAGILFAKTGTPKIDGYNSKAIAVKGTGQFTAQPSTENESIARGYMICKNGDEYKVIYAD